jgi:uncharacterized FAD-dependent dehydrogenase
MGYKEIDVKISVFASTDELRKVIGKTLRITNFTFHILKKSLDARKRNNISWQYIVGINSEELHGGTPAESPGLNPIYKKRDKHVAIVGSGPAGTFSAILLALSGFRVTLIERGSNVEARKKAIHAFESKGVFGDDNNYAFGEGGAGTFSDGKLTSRTKGINRERNFIYDQFIQAGAPEEIRYMTHPHLGTDNLFLITRNFRTRLIELGCSLYFDRKLEDLRIKNNRILALITSDGIIEADHFILAIGHSAYETYRMLIGHNIPFQTKNFAIGFRAEHVQEIINLAQWGTTKLPGIHSAEYRLTADTTDHTPVYSFCMCPGGKVVPATAYKHTNIVNGMGQCSCCSGYQPAKEFSAKRICSGNTGMA